MLITDSLRQSAPLPSLTTCFVEVTVPLVHPPDRLRDVIEVELRSLGSPLRWAVTELQQGHGNQQMVQVEAVITIEAKIPDSPRISEPFSAP